MILYYIQHIDVNISKNIYAYQIYHDTSVDGMPKSMDCQVSSLYRCMGQLGDVHFAADGTAEVGPDRIHAEDGGPFESRGFPDLYWLVVWNIFYFSIYWE